jgi:GH43 family beta-xylosidase
MNLRNIFNDRSPCLGQDPHVSKVNDTFILCESIDEERIALSTLDSLDFPRRTSTTIVWDDPSERQVWAPELHFIHPYWYIYYSASDGCNETHRIKGLCGLTPLGPYHLMGTIGPDIWGIDMTTFEWDNKRYAVWSGWEENGDQFPQNLYIGEMIGSWSIDQRVKLAVPEYDWEKSIQPILEGPQIWIRNDKLSILYSANASWKQEYCTGMLDLVGRDPLNPNHWRKRPMSILYNAGHGCVVNNHFIHHTKLSSFPGWTDRVLNSKILGENDTWIR